jgi:multicomponent Na+:H+ antiporter subunit E
MNESMPGRRRKGSAGGTTLLQRGVAIAMWAFAVWLLLTWTVAAEQLITGAVIAVGVAAAMAPLRDVVAPWQLLQPRRLAAVLALAGLGLIKIVRANISLAVRIWRPTRPLKSGMVVVPTTLRSDGGLASVGLISSLIVDNQIVDLEREQHVLQYHAVEVPEGTKSEQAEAINAPIERLVAKIERGGR